MRPLALLGALLLSACSNDVFVGPDGATGDGGGTSDGGGAVDGSTLDAPTIQTDIKCNNNNCTGHICCAPQTGWDLASCASITTENQLSCQMYLECDDINDCPGGQVCCAQQYFNSAMAKNLITTSRCSSTCATNTGSIQLCLESSECLAGSCQGNQGNPSWLKTCQ